MVMNDFLPNLFSFEHAVARYACGCLYICVVSTGHLEYYNVLMILNVGSGKIIVGSDPCMYCTCLEEVCLVLFIVELMCLCLVVYIYSPCSLEYIGMPNVFAQCLSPL